MKLNTNRARSLLNMWEIDGGWLEVTDYERFFPLTCLLGKSEYANRTEFLFVNGLYSQLINR